LLKENICENENSGTVGRGQGKERKMTSEDYKLNQETLRKASDWLPALISTLNPGETGQCDLGRHSAKEKQEKLPCPNHDDCQIMILLWWGVGW
jgi:hypothetical protein